MQEAEDGRIDFYQGEELAMSASESNGQISVFAKKSGEVQTLEELQRRFAPLQTCLR